jgi:perosamine synthetase
VLAERVRYFKNLCFSLDRTRDYIHDDIGFNYRMSNLHAAIGLAQMEKADFYRERRIEHGKLYRQLLKAVDGISFQEEWARDPRCTMENVYWMNGIVVDEKAYGRSREQLIGRLAAGGVETRRFFRGMNRQPSLVRYGCRMDGEYPITDSISERGLYLPSASSLTDEQIRYVCGLIIEGFSA